MAMNRTNQVGPTGQHEPRWGPSAGYSPEGFWLWIVPQLAGYRPGKDDLMPYLERGITLFQEKERWGGQRPNAVKVNRDHVSTGLGPTARALGLRVIVDHRVPTEAFWLGMVDLELVPGAGG